MPRLRPELLRYATSDGGCQVVDLLLEAVHHFSAEEATALDSLPGELPAQLHARLNSAMLLETPAIEALRRQAWAARIRRRALLPKLPATKGPWQQATKLPAIVSSQWRTAERWRRLAEAAAAGSTPLHLDGFVTDTAAHAFAAAASNAPMVRMDNDYCRASCSDALVLDSAICDWADVLQHPSLRSLVGAVLRLQLPERFQAKVWALRAGDEVGPHADGIRYVATMSLGLCAAWTAQHGGAIAFGEPAETGFVTRQRWLPHLGDVLLFRPEAWGWHAVEPVAAKTRYTLTCQWIGEGGSLRPLTR